MTIYCVKTRKIGKVKWGFVTSRGGVSYLRIHAAQFKLEETALSMVADINENNPGEWEAHMEVFSSDRDTK